MLCCTHGHPEEPTLLHFQGCSTSLCPHSPPPHTFLAPPHGILLPQGDLHVESVAVVPEGDPGRVLQRFGTAAAVAPLVRAGGTWGTHGALGVGGGAQGVGVPQHVGAPNPARMLTGGMLSPTLGRSPPGPPCAEPRHVPPRPSPARSWQMPPCSLVSQPAVRQLPSTSM